jgi:NADH-quinone oxidoreductase subunit H
MIWPRALAPFAAALAFVGILAGVGALAIVAPVVGPALVQVTGLAPADVEPGDRITLAGQGFPAGKEARVTFRGTLHRPGEATVRDVEIAATGLVTGPEQVEVEFREGTQTLFCGAGDRAVHSTFEGDVEVAFAAAAPGAAPVAGTLRHAVLDVRPSASVADTAREPEGRRVLAFLGLHVEPPARRGIGLMVEAVDPGSRAAASGVVAGDVLTTFDGVRAAAIGDLVPVPGEHEATIGVRSAGAVTDAPRAIAVDGLGGAPPAEFLGAALFIVGALSVLLFFGATPPSMLGAAVQRAAGRLRARVELASPANRSAVSAWARVGRAMRAGVLREALPAASSSTVVDAVGAALFAVLPFGQYLVAARLDVGILFLAATTALAVAAVAGARSAWDGLRGAAHVAWQHVPAAVAVTSVVLTTGSLRVQEIDHAQGGAPWDWLAFRSPAALLATLLLLGCALIEPDLEAAASGASALVEDVSLLPARSRGSWLEAARRAHRFVIAGLASVLFLGGWSLPGLSPAQQDGRLALEAAGAAWLLGKTAALVLAISAVRWTLPRRRLVESTRTTTLARLPLALAALALSAAWVWWTPQRAAQLLMSGSLVGATMLVAIAVIQRLRHDVLSAGGDGHLSPFL